MALVFAYVPDLLFGSNVLGMLKAAGHDAVLLADEESLRSEAERHTPDVLVLDLTDDAPARVEMIGRVRADGLLDGVKIVAFYSHVDRDTRTLAEEADYDLVVPRSRFAREGAELVAQAVAT
jgi:DNA-binding response OmpR family regulator